MTEDDLEACAQRFAGRSLVGESSASREARRDAMEAMHGEAMELIAYVRELTLAGSILQRTNELLSAERDELLIEVERLKVRLAL